VLNAGSWSLWCRSCPWRTKPTPVGPDAASFRAARAVAEAAWHEHNERDREHQAEGAPADRLLEVGSAPPRDPARGGLMRPAGPYGPLGVAWRCWLVLLLLGFAVLIVVLATVVVPAIWHGSGIARPAGVVVLGIYALEGWALWRWAGHAAALLPPTRPGRYVLLALVQTGVGVGLGWMVFGR
jgi:hypothetical protein